MTKQQGQVWRIFTSSCGALSSPRLSTPRGAPRSPSVNHIPRFSPPESASHQSQFRVPYHSTESNGSRKPNRCMSVVTCSLEHGGLPRAFGRGCWQHYHVIYHHTFGTPQEIPFLLRSTRSPSGTTIGVSAPNPEVVTPMSQGGK